MTRSTQALFPVVGFSAEGHPFRFRDPEHVDPEVLAHVVAAFDRARRPVRIELVANSVVAFVRGEPDPVELVRYARAAIAATSSSYSPDLSDRRVLRAFDELVESPRERRRRHLEHAARLLLRPIYAILDAIP